MDRVVQGGQQLLGIIVFAHDHVDTKRPEFGLAGFRSLPRRCDDFQLKGNLFLEPW